MERMAAPHTSTRFLVSLCIALALCATSTADAKERKSAQHSSKSGIEGTVFLGPGCPGPVRLDRPCPDQMYKGAMVIKRVSDGKTVAQTETDDNGRFRVALPPGRYFISNVPGPAYPRIHSSEIVVHRNRFTKVELHADTGMR